MTKPLVQRLRERLITVPKPGAKPFKPTYPISYTYTAGTVHKAGDSAGYVTFNPTMGACAAGYDPNHVMAIEHIFIVDPLLEEAAQALEGAAVEPSGCPEHGMEHFFEGMCIKCGVVPAAKSNPPLQKMEHGPYDEVYFEGLKWLDENG